MTQVFVSCNFNFDTRASSRYPELPSSTSSGVGGQFSSRSGVSIVKSSEMTLERQKSLIIFMIFNNKKREAK